MTYGGARSIVIPNGSPFMYQNTSAQRQVVLISGGLITTTEFSRDGAMFDPIGSQCVLNPLDRIRVTYVLAPAIAVYPL